MARWKKDEENEEVQPEVEALQTLIDEDAKEVKLEEALPYTPKETAELTSVKLLVSAIKYNGVDCVVVVTVNEPLRGFVLPAANVVNTRAEQEVDLTGAQEIYDWSSELEFLYPDIETVRKNVLLSFWRAGALSQKDLSNKATRQKLFASAYPYRLP